MTNRLATQHIRDILISRVKNVKVYVGPEVRPEDEGYEGTYIFVMEYSGANETTVDGGQYRRETNINLIMRDESFVRITKKASEITTLLANCDTEYNNRTIEWARVEVPAYLGRRTNNTQHSYSLDVDTHQVFEVDDVIINDDIHKYVGDDLYFGYSETQSELLVTCPSYLVISGDYDSISEISYNVFKLINVNNMEIKE